MSSRKEVHCKPVDLHGRYQTSAADREFEKDRYDEAVRWTIGVIAVTVLMSAWSQPSNKPATESKYSSRQDFHSFSNPHQVRVKHVALDLTVSFPVHTLKGTVTLTVERQPGAADDTPLILDSRDLKVASVRSSSDGQNFADAKWEAGPADKLLGTPITIHLSPGANQVRIEYETSPGATALQWLTPEQTAGKRAPYLYTQGQSIHTRSWIPLQDSPGVRVTYTARIHTPKNVMAIMSARNQQARSSTGEYEFHMPQPIPPYLIALAVGDLEYKAIGPRTGVYAEPSIAASAAKEFEDLESMMKSAESLYGPYRWEQYDVLVLPPSFPYGGMENPRLTFVSPTLLAGDKSLVSVVSHELAHSWSGNLVTNATWRDFWLNESFTTYLERRIQEVVYGPERSAMEAVIEREQMLQELPSIPKEEQMLYPDLKGKDPDEIPAPIAYTKGSLLLRRLEQVWGRERFDTFLRTYFGHYAFQSITTGDFVSYLRNNLLNQDAELAGKVDLDEWLSQPGVPDTAPVAHSEALNRAAEFAGQWVAGKVQTSSLPAAKWSVYEWLRFLLALPNPVDKAKLAELDKAFGMSRRGNAEILFQWLIVCVRSGYQPAYPAVEQFLTHVGRRKFVKPLYDELVKTPEGKRFAQSIYSKARPGYHFVTQSSVDALLK